MVPFAASGGPFSGRFVTTADEPDSLGQRSARHVEPGFGFLFSDTASFQPIAPCQCLHTPTNGSAKMDSSSVEMGK
ncbi:plasmid partition ParA protein [Anopheles sinensis]|uniref:Plasmid partition ParA protein n=1 Tax=Anopheles sinensis TaxID=74873 RepID=A0A084W1D7_ANOSI|nr:plasmid partition ParA protein [Anopheles sinensis]